LSVPLIVSMRSWPCCPTDTTAPAMPRRTWLRQRTAGDGYEPVGDAVCALIAVPNSLRELAGQLWSVCAGLCHTLSYLWETELVVKCGPSLAFDYGVTSRTCRMFFMRGQSSPILSACTSAMRARGRGVGPRGLLGQCWRDSQPSAGRLLDPMLTSVAPPAIAATATASTHARCVAVR
jgi:hypothetical protein